jgi:spermidine synthase
VTDDEAVTVPARPRLGAVAAGALVFGTSGAVLVLEILAGRLLAPYVGVTLQTYTGIIGTVLAGIALGTWWGGWLADRHDPARLLGPAVIAGGALALCTVPLIRLFGPTWAGGGAGAIVALSVLGFLAPAVVLSTVTPLVIKLQLRDLGETGSVVGRLSALGTAGAIAGTFLSGFVLIEAAPTSRLIPGIGVVLVLTGLAVWLLVGRGGGRAVAGASAAALAALMVSVAVGDPCDIETRYYCARIEVDPERPTGRVLVLDDLRHSYVDLDDPSHLEFRYVQAFAAVTDAAWPEGRPIDAVHVGGGGFTMPRWLAATRPGSTSSVLELDPGVVELAVDRLGLRTGPDLEAVVGDARLSLAERPTGSTDLVVGDAFGGVAVPWHLTTREVVDEVHRILRPGGIYVVNVIDRGPMRFARAEVATLAERFGEVVVIGPEPALAGLGGNVVLVAGDRLPSAGALDDAARAAGGQRVVSGAELDRWLGDAPVLTDDLAPVDQLLTTGR